MESPSPARRLADLAERYWRFQCEEFPLNAILAGEPGAGATLFRAAPADEDRRYEAAGRLLQELNSISGDALAGQERVTARLLGEELRDARTLYEAKSPLRPPLLPVGPEFGATHFANTAAIHDTASAERYVERLATLPRFIRDLKAVLIAGHAEGFRYPRAVLDAAVPTARAPLKVPVDASPWTGPFTRSPALGREAVKQLESRARGLIENELLPAIADYADLLDGSLRESARESIACLDDRGGRELYLALVRHYTTTDLTPEAIHELGQEELARLATEIEDVAASAGHPGDVATYRDRLSSDPGMIEPTKESLRMACESLAKRIDKRIPAFFGRIPRITYGIESLTEAASVHLPPAYAQPNPADRTAPGIFWLTALPQRCPKYMLLPLTLHEAWPGHLMHLALMQEMEDLPAFRRHGALKYTAYVEGWALYCESLGVEMGLYDKPHQHYGRLEMEIWRALRMVVDTGIHWLGWSRTRAIETMLQHMAMPRATIEAEVDRYIGLPGQALAYQLGNLRIRSLRHRAESFLGDRFYLRAFHDRVLAAGPVSLPVLDTIVEEWLVTG